jgi:hypothetical protein
MKGKTFRADFDSTMTSKIELFKEKEELSTDSAAIKKLVTFALDIMERSSDAPIISNRELMEEMFLAVRESGAMICQAHAYTYNPDVVESLGKASIKVRAGAKEFGRKRGEAFLSGEK